MADMLSSSFDVAKLTAIAWFLHKQQLENATRSVSFEE
jgi:hypothetical protein